MKGKLLTSQELLPKPTTLLFIHKAFQNSGDIIVVVLYSYLFYLYNSHIFFLNFPFNDYSLPVVYVGNM